jgi:hypothetical protein
VTAFLLVFATQALDALGLMLALGKGHEANPLMSAILAAGGIGALLAVKLGVGALIAVGVAAIRPGLAPWFGLIGCAGALSALVVRLGA